ncbi:MAG: hypothetical protein D6706_21735, partial [Chloroflexi bacterium]
TIHNAVSDASDTVPGATSDALDTVNKNFNDIVVDPLFGGSESAFWKSLASVAAAPFTGGYSLAALPFVGGNKGIMGKGLSALGISNAVGSILGNSGTSTYTKLAGADRMAGASGGGFLDSILGGAKSFLGGLGDKLGLSSLFDGSGGFDIGGLLKSGLSSILGGGSDGSINASALSPLIGAILARNTKEVPHLTNLYTSLAGPVGRTNLGSDIAATMLLGDKAGTGLVDLVNTPAVGTTTPIPVKLGATSAQAPLNFRGGLLGMALTDPISAMQDPTTTFMQSKAYDNMQKMLRASGGNRSAYAAKLLTDTMNDIAFKRYQQQFDAMKTLYNLGQDMAQVGANTGLNLGTLMTDINKSNAGIYNTGRNLLGQGVTDVFANLEAQRQAQQMQPLIDAVMKKVGSLLG